MGEIPWSILKSILHRWVQYLGHGWERPLGSRKGPPAIVPQLFGSSAVVWYVMCTDFLNGILWVKLHGRYWYQSFIDGSNIWGVDRTNPWGPEMDHPPLGRSYLVVESSCYMAFIIVTFVWLSLYIYIFYNNGWLTVWYRLYSTKKAILDTRCSRIQYNTSESNIIYIGRSTIQYQKYYSL